MRVLEVEDVVRLLRSEVERAGGQASWAKRAGVHRTVVNSVINGRRPPTKNMIMALNLRVVFVSKSGPPHSPSLSPVIT
jgi:plasmid maintenance system antidote protein VapI